MQKKTFLDQGNYWRHTHKKNACISLQKVQEIIQEKQMHESRLQYFETKQEIYQEEKQKIDGNNSNRTKDKKLIPTPHLH